LADDGQLEPGEQISIGVYRGVVREVTPTVSGGEVRLVVDLTRP
jgi:hypothetical protein